MRQFDYCWPTIIFMNWCGLLPHNRKDCLDFLFQSLANQPFISVLQLYYYSITTKFSIPNVMIPSNNKLFSESFVHSHTCERTVLRQALNQRKNALLDFYLIIVPNLSQHFSCHYKRSLLSNAGLCLMVTDNYKLPIKYTVRESNPCFSRCQERLTI